VTRLHVALLEPAATPIASELGAGLSASGHRVELLDGRRWGPLERRLVRRGYDEGFSTFPGLYLSLHREMPDVAHAFNPVAAAAALRWRRRTGRPVLLSLPEQPGRQWLLARRGRLDAVRRADRDGATIIVRDQASADALSWSLGLAAIVVEPGSAAAHESLYSALLSASPRTAPTAT
jgi:hypothetical protein